MPEPESARKLPTDIDYSVLVPLLCHSFIVQCLVALLRLTVSYRIIEQDMPVVWLGLISGAFALLPVFLAVQVGRFIDRGNDARATWIGSSLVAGPAIALYFAPGNAYYLVAYALLIGVGHLFLMASHQMLCVRAGGERGRDVAFANFTVAQALGQGLAPLLLGWIGGAARLPPTELLFGISAVGALVSVAIAFTLRPISRAAAPAKDQKAVPILDLLKTPGLPPVLFASIMTITASDLLTIYLPLMGTERHMDVAHVGGILTMRSVCSIGARIFFAQLVRIVGRQRLLVVCMAVGGLGFLLVALPLPLWGLYLAGGVLGLGIGIASSLTITAIVEVVPVQARGTAMTLRITGNRIGQVALPFLASFVAAATGAAGVLGVIAINLWAAGIAVQRNRRNSS
jgi:MFS family permease